MPTKLDSAATLDGFASIDGWTYTRLHAPTHLKLEVTPPPSVGSGDGGGAERPQSMRAKQRETSDDEEEQRLCRPACIIPPTVIKVLHSMVGYHRNGYAHRRGVRVSLMTSSANEPHQLRSNDCSTPPPQLRCRFKSEKNLSSRIDGEI
jgi:hypothetical protein